MSFKLFGFVFGNTQEPVVQEPPVVQAPVVQEPPVVQAPSKIERLTGALESHKNRNKEQTESANSWEVKSDELLQNYGKETQSVLAETAAALLLAEEIKAAKETADKAEARAQVARQNYEILEVSLEKSILSMKEHQEALLDDLLKEFDA
jgi:hypothetical protein